MKKSIYFLLLFLAGGCMLEDRVSESPPLSMFSYEGKNRNGVGLLTLLTQQTLIQEQTLSLLSTQEELLYEYAELHTGPFYGMHYLIPIRDKVTHMINKAFVYKILEEECERVSAFCPIISEIVVLDAQELNRIPAYERFLYSYPFKHWKEQGLNVADGFTDFAKKLDGKWHRLEANELPVPTSRVPASFVTMTYELHLNNEVAEDGGVIVYGIPSYVADSIFLSNQDVLEFYLEETVTFHFDYRKVTIRLIGGDLLSNPNLDEAIGEFMAANDLSFQNEFPFYQAITWEITATSANPPSGGDNTGGNSSGGSTGGGSSPSNPGGESGSKSPIELMDVTKFVGYNVSGDCFEGCTLIMQNYGVPPGSRLHVYRLLAEDEITRELFYWGNDPADNYTKAIACIDRHLDAIPPRPIIVGLNESPEMGVNEGTTDHFVVITGRGYDESKEMYYYTYMETGVSNVNQGCDTENNRLYYDAENLTFRGVAQYREDDSENKYQYDVIQVRPNDGKNLNETESYELINE